MKPNRKQSRIIIFGLPLLVLLALLFQWPAQPKLIVPLADGTRFVLLGTDHGQQLFYGGGGWQSVICKIIRHNLPPFVRYQPEIWPSFYTNGIGLSFRRQQPDKSTLPQEWNGNGQLYFLDESGAEREVRYHGVNFNVENLNGRDVVASEDISWELPIVQEPELRLRIRETNDKTGAVSTHDFSIKNPAR